MADEDEDDRDGDEDAADDGSAVRPVGRRLQRASMALPPREGGLHLSPHDSIGSVNDRSCAASRSQTTAAPGPVTAARSGSRRRAPGRARVARHPARDDARAGRAAGHRAADRRLHRVRPVGRLAPRRPPRPDLRAAPAPAPRRAAGRPRRRRDGHDRRPVGSVDRAQPARPGDARARTSRPSAASSSASSTSRPGAGGAIMVNNLDWLGELSLIDFLRDTGKHFTVPYMLAKDSVQVAPGARAVVHRVQLHAPAGVRLLAPPPDDGRRAADGRRRPVGQHHRRPRADPADERGGRGRADEQPAHGLPTSCCSRRRARSSARARPATRVWLDPARTTPFAFYQYWLNTDDRDVGTYLRWFTELAARARSRRSTPAARSVPRPARRSAPSRATSRPGPTAPRPPRPRSAMPRRCSLDGAVADPEVLASLYRLDRRVHVHAGRAGRGAGGRSWPTPAWCASRGEARRLIAGGGVTDQRRHGHRSGDAVPEPIAGEWLEVALGKRRREIGRRVPG